MTSDSELFDLDSIASYAHPDVPGLVIAKSALLPPELAAILHGMNQANWFSSSRNGQQDQIMLFGTIPAFLHRVGEIGESMLPSHLKGRRPVWNQGICNRYLPGGGLKHHVDLARFSDGIMVASITSSCVMEFKRDEKQADVFLEAGDVVVISGEARWSWTHGIPQREVDLVDGLEKRRGVRVSVTLRYMEPDE